MSARVSPGGRNDAIYERLIEIQERQNAIAESQVAAGMQRQHTDEKLGEMVGQIATMLDRRSPTFDLIRRNIEDSPEERLKAVNEVKSHVDKACEKMGNKMDGLWWRLAVATFLGSALGNGVGTSIIDWFFKLKP